MKKTVLSFALGSATLFLATARADEPKPSAQTPTAVATPVPTPGVSVDSTKPVTRQPPLPAMDSAQAELLKRFDTNHDGKLDEDELAVAHETMLKENLNGTAGSERVKKIRAAVIQRFDLNGDGKLDEQEKAAMQKYFLGRFDTNHDGRLDENERAAMREQLRADAKAGKFLN